MENRSTQSITPSKRLRIGILTFHRAHNCGAFLQCYALQEYLKASGRDAEVIDYEPEYFKDGYGVLPRVNFSGLSFPRRVRRRIGMAVLFVPRVIRRILFGREIREYLNLSPARFSRAEDFDSARYDIIFIGSDQVWNPVLTRGNDALFWGRFDFAGKKVAYAASAGDDFSVLKGREEYIRDALADFSLISVREKELGACLRRNFGIASQSVLDPTLLLDAGGWNEFAGGKRAGGKYVLLYVVKPAAAAPKIAEKIAGILGIRVRVIMAGVGKNPRSWKDACVPPRKFVSLFRDAQFIVTTSFHGTSFAVNFRKEFYAVNTGKPDVRVETLLRECSLMRRYIKTESEIDLSAPTDYSRTGDFEDLKMMSKDFIDSACRTAEEEASAGRGGNKDCACIGGGYRCIVFIASPPSSRPPLSEAA